MLFNKNFHKILAIGSAIMVRRLTAKIDLGQFSVTGCRNVTEALTILENEIFDIVIIDNLVHNAESVCKNAVILGDTPVALLLQEKPANWHSLGTMNVDGYLPDGGTDAEFMARIRAFSRRKPAACTCP